MTADLAAAYRAIAESLPPETPVPVPAGALLELLSPNGGEPAVLPIGKPSANGASNLDEQLLTVQEVADRFGLTTDWLYRHWEAVGGMKLGRKVLRFPASAVPRHIAILAQKERERAARRKTP